MDKEKSLSFREKMAFIWIYLRVNQKQVFVYAGLVLLASLMSAVYPYLTGRIIDVATGKATFGNLNWQQLAVILGLVMLSGMMIREVLDYLIQKLTMRISAVINLDLLGHIFKLKFSNLESKTPGELQKILDRLLDAIMRLTEMMIYSFMPQIVNLVIALIVISFFSLSLSLMLFGSVILFLFFSLCYKMPLILKLQKSMNESFNEQFSNIADSVSNITTVKSFVTAESELSAKKQRWLKIRKEVQAIARLYVNYGMAQGSINIMMRLITIFWTVHFFQQDKLSTGELVAIISYVNWAMGPMFMLANNIRDFRRKLVDLEDAAKIKQDEVETDNTNAEEHTIKGRVTFLRVNFAYPGRDHLTLRDISISLESGQSLAIVGQTGSGKSTLYKLLQRMYPLKSGTILIDGIDIHNIKLESLRRQIAIVEQNPELFSGTIGANIAYGHPNASLEEIRKAAAIAQLDEEIMSEAFPEHYDTKIGGKGGRLSGGQIQRIALARAIINKPKILVLDEATNSLDLLTKHKILESLQQHIKGLTTVVISHDLSAMVRQADQIIVMSAGQIVQQGTHEQLLEQEGVYGQYWQMQKCI